jgi:hypothetical protein
MVKWSAVAVLGVLLLAGCADGNATEAEVLPEAFNEVVVTSTTGAIRGIIISEAIVPIPDATVTLIATNTTQVTNQDGAFVFSGLEPGSHFLSISKPGYFTMQTSTEVVPGVEDPPIVKVQLTIDIANQPFTELLQWAAFLQCGFSVPMVGSVNPCALADSDNVHEFPFGANRTPDLVQVEAVWEGTQPLGNYLSMGFYDPDSLASNWKSVDGSSPLIVNATAAEITDALTEDADKTIVRVFPGTGPDGTNPVLVLNQRYDIYVTHFYGFVPRAGWSFAVDGPCTTPEECA